MPYFNMVETDTTYQDDPGDFHGSNGPIICHRFPQEEWRQGSRVWFEAWRDNGQPYCEDHNAPGTTGVGPTPLNNPDGIRWSAAIGYLGLSRHRLNLTIRANVTVKRILFDTTGERPRATGVEAVSDGETFVVEAGEIILSAGAIGSPQILMLSGVGPGDHLMEHGIETVIDSPGVGQNLADHPLINILWATKPEVELQRFAANSQLLVRYTAEGSPLDNDMIVYLNAGAGTARNKGGGHGDLVGLGAALGLNLALSKGEVRLRSNDYRDQPHLNYNLLDHEEDRRRYRDGVRLLVSLEDHPAMSAAIDKRVYPEDSDLESDEALDLWMKRWVGTGHHVSCTAKMGPSSDPHGRGGPVRQGLRNGGSAGSGRLDHARVRPGQHQRHCPDDGRARRRLHQAREVRKGGTMASVEYNPAAQFEVETSDLVYLEHESGNLEATIYQPQEEGPFPGLLNVHGGRWFLGDRSADHLMNSALAASGIVVVAIDFRLAPHHPYPAQIVDANYATRWMKAQYRQLNIDPDSVGAMGCSSGGHTVALNGMRPKDPRYASLPLLGGENVDASLRFMVCCWPVVDPYARYLWGRGIGDERFIGPTESYFVEPESIHEGNPQEALDRGEALELPPAIIIQGTDDNNVPLYIPAKFETTYRAAGGDIERKLFPGMPHAFGNIPGAESERAIELMKGFIARQLSRPVVAPL